MNINLTKIDQWMDRMPVLSTVNNFVDLSLKGFYLPLISREKINRSRYFIYLESKKARQCAILLLPLIGNALHQRHNKIAPINGLDRWTFDPRVTGDKCLAAQKIKSAVNSLDLASLQLNKLPSEIGLLTNIGILYLYNNHLTFLPTEIGQLTNLIALYLYHNELTSLPTEIGMLTNLCQGSLLFSNNCLTFLPTEIGRLTRLTQLDVNDNNLTSLPTEIGQLSHLHLIDLSKNPNLSELPMCLGQMPNLNDIRINGTAIPRAIRDTILHQCRRLRDGEAKEVLPSRLDKWQAFAQSPTPFTISLTESQVFTLNEWLQRLEKTRDFAKCQTSLAKTVWEILGGLENTEFKELFFSQAEANNECCQDRAAMSLNEIYTSWLLLCKSPENLKVLHGVAKTLRLRKELQMLIQKNMPHERESVEIFLYYETHLREVLQLETAIKNMAYDALGKRSWIDQKALIKEVQSNYYEELIEIPLFAKKMEKRWEPLNQEFQAKLEALGECPEGSEHDLSVLNWKVKQGELLTEWKKRKILVC